MRESRVRIGTRVLVTALVAMLVVLAIFGAAALVLVQRVLEDDVDATLERGSRVAITQINNRGDDACSVARLGDDSGTGSLPGFVVVTMPSGERCASDDVVRVPPITAEERRIQQGSAPASWRTVEGQPPLRVYSSQAFDGSLVQVVQPIADQRAVVRRLAMLLIGGLLVVLVGFSYVGARLLRTSLRPLPDLADQLDGIARLGSGASRIPVPQSDDEIARLAERFNELMARLEAAERDRRSVLADASHELRTPVTALRMNIEVLAERDDELPADLRASLISDAARQAGDLARLVDGVVRVAREGEQEREGSSVIDVADMLGQVAVAARRPGLAIEVRADGGELGGLEIEAPPGLVTRAVAAIVDNAAVHGGRNGDSVSVELRAAPGLLEVIDDGAGLEVDEDEASFLLERFARAPAARARAGSGLGLAIARDVAERLGGSISIANRDDGVRGAVVRLHLPRLRAASARGSLDPHSGPSAGVQQGGRQQGGPDTSTLEHLHER